MGFVTDTLCQGIFPLTVPGVSRGLTYRAFKHFDFVAKPNQISVELAERLHVRALHGLYGFHVSLRNRCCHSCRNQLLRGSFGNKKSHQLIRLAWMGASSAMNLLLQANDLRFCASYAIAVAALSS